MSKFTDNKGREHEFEVTVNTLLQVKKALAFDIAKLLLADSDEIRRWSDDPILACELCFLVCQSRLPEDKRIKIEDFYDGLAGDALEHATHALLEAIADFYPRPEQRAYLRNLAKRSTSITSKAYRDADQRLSSMTDETLMEEAAKVMKAKKKSPDPSDSSTASTMTNESPESRSEPSDSASNLRQSSDSVQANSAN